MYVTLPALISSSPGWPVVAELLDGPDEETRSTTASKAMQRLEKRLSKIAKQNAISPAAQWASGELFQKSFPVQPMYIYQGRRYLAGPSIQFPVRIVRLRDDRGNLYCLLPDLGAEFFCPSEDLFATMLAETVRSITATMTPQQAVEFWPPTSSELKWVRVKVPRASKAPRSVRTKVLHLVAEPLARKSFPFIPVGSQLHAGYELDQVLSRGSCILVGESGVGKTAMLQASAKRLQKIRQLERKREEKASGLARWASLPQFWQSSGGRLIAGMQYLGQWQERLEAIIAELSDIGGVLAIENMRDLLSLGGASPRDSLGAFMVPYIKNDQLRIVVESTPEELDACRKLFPAFIDAIPMVRVEPLQAQDEVEILERLFVLDQQHHKTSFEPPLPSLIQRWCSQFQNYASPPGPSVQFARKLLAAKPPKRHSVEEAVQKFVQITGLPESMIRDDWILQRSDVASELQKDVIGQDHACHIASGIVTKIKAAMNDRQRPFSCILLCGPTGVGKTQLAKSLSNYLYGHGESKASLVRLDMSEYSGIAAGYRFLQDGSDKPAAWIQKIRAKPLSVLLLDEIEKAGSEVFDILLSLLDEGRLTDRSGRTTSFRNTLVLMTSNLGVRPSTAVGFTQDAIPDYVSEVKKAFRPEFFNRLDHVIPFRPLSPEVIRLITAKELQETESREGITRLRLTLQFTEGLISRLAEIGFHPHLGARPLQRAIETRVIAPLSHWLLDHPVYQRTLNLDWDRSIDQLTVSLAER